MNQVFIYIKRNWLPLVMVLIPSGLFLGPIPFSTNLYYALLIILSILAIFKAQGISKAGIILLVACAISIIVGNANPLFKSWSRLGLFSLLLIAYFPIFKSEYFDGLRHSAFPIMMIVLTFTSVGSFICYFLGINYMTKAFKAYADSVTVDTTGWFGGLTYQSMMLGPICALALTFLVWVLVRKSKTKRLKWIIALIAFMSLCCMMLTASRSANAAGIIGAVTILWIRYKSQLGNLMKVGVIVVLLSIVLSPLYMPYADKVMSKQYANAKAGTTFASRQSHWEHRIEEFSEYPLFGYGFAAINTKNHDEYQAGSGTIEPGSSWLAILSMTGLVGTIAFLTLFISTLYKLYYLFIYDNDGLSILYIGLMMVFCTHFIAEGYIFSGGGALCFIFWFLFGCAYSYARNPIQYSMLEEQL